MKLSDVRRIALALPEVTEQPHHHMCSFRVRGKIFVTVHPDEEHIHVFVPDAVREPALAMHADFVEKLAWGGKVVGLRISLRAASRPVVAGLIQEAWASKAPRALVVARSRL